MDTVHTGHVSPAMQYLATMATAYRHDEPAGFNQAVQDYRQWLEPHFAKELRKGYWEYYYNTAKPFLHAMIVYLCAFLLAVGALLTMTLSSNLSESLRRSAFYLVLLAGAVHTVGLIFRMVLEGRPPVTNLYSSAIFIGWGAMVFGLGLERFFKLGLGSAAASLSGFVTLIIAHNLALGGDTMEMLRAVLDTNFWLATHVVVITLGYSATFMAGLLAIGYVLLGLFTPVLSTQVRKLEVGKILHKMVYAIICFAALFSFVGTVLGGIWADQSWGRFWGWDPKENGALIIVLWNAAILHARWGKLVGRTRVHQHGNLWQHRDELLLVRGQHARHWLALVWLHGRRLQMAAALHCEPVAADRHRDVAAEILGQLPPAQSDQGHSAAFPRRIREQLVWSEIRINR